MQMVNLDLTKTNNYDTKKINTIIIIIVGPENL